ncbi:MAG TPA: GTP cyclohydrolase II [Terriglobales bacterium]
MATPHNFTPPVLKRPTGATQQKVASHLPAVHLVAEADFPTRWGRFRILGFESEAAPASASESAPETAIVLRWAEPDAAAGAPPLLRIHSQCLTGDVFGSLRCDCRQQLELALGAIASEGGGLLIYEDKEGRGIGLMNKLRAYALQDQGADTVEANERLGLEVDGRDYALPAAILLALDVRAVRLLSNNPDKIQALERAGVRVVERIACTPENLSEHARRYLEVKREKLGHLAALDSGAPPD